MKKKKNAAPAAKSLQSLGLESFEVMEVQRGQIKNAKYNPRVMSDAEKRKLRAGIKKHGLVAPITWNKRTGNCVGGHQRLEQTDALAGTEDYSLKVAVIDVDEKREKEINILLNNDFAQGDFDLKALRDLLSPMDSLEGTGFDRADLFQLFGENIWNSEDPDKLNELADRARALSKQYADMQLKIQSRGSEDYYLVVVFENAEQKDQFLADAKLEVNRYQSGSEFRRLMGLKGKSTR